MRRDSDETYERLQRGLPEPDEQTYEKLREAVDPDTEPTFLDEHLRLVAADVNRRRRAAITQEAHIIAARAKLQP